MWERSSGNNLTIKKVESCKENEKPWDCTKYRTSASASGPTTAAMSAPRCWLSFAATVAKASSHDAAFRAPARGEDRSWNKVMVVCARWKTSGESRSSNNSTGRTRLVADEGRCETLALETVVCKASLVRDPLLVDRVVGARQDAHHLGVNS